MTKYFCYRKHPEWFTAHKEASFPAYKEKITFGEWVKQGQPTDDSIHFLGQGNQPPQLKAYFDQKKNTERGRNGRNRIY